MIDSSISLSDFSADPDKVLSGLCDHKQPTLLTRDGRGIAVVQDLDSFEADQEEKKFMCAVVQGLSDLEHGREYSLQEVKQKLRLS